MGLFSRKAPPQSVEAMAVASPNTRFNPNWAFTYERKRLPGPGAQNYAFELLGLVEFSPIGPTEHNRIPWQVVQPPPLYMHFATMQQGVGGLSQGTIYGQPLVVAPGSSETGINA